MRELSLFSGAGGGLLGTHLLGWRPVGYVEWNEYCQRVIAARIKDGILPNAPIFGDIHAFNSEGYAAAYSGLVDVVTGGFPCQPFSLAGKRLAADDPRNGWPATIECLRLVRPRYALLENVPGLVTSGYFGTVLGDLAESGFDCRWRVLSAAEVGAPHKRDRLWIVAHTHRREQRRREQPQRRQDRGDANAARNGTQRQLADAEKQPIGTGLRTNEPAEQRRGRPSDSSSKNDDANSKRQGLAFGQGETGERSQPATAGNSWWAVEPDVGRVAHELAPRLDITRTIIEGLFQ